jgi:hypothetical protein
MQPFMGNNESKENNFTGMKFSPLAQKNASKNIQRQVKKQRFADSLNAADNGDASSDSDKEQTLTAYYSSAIALANTPEERKRRESRSKRFEKGQGRQENNHFKPKKAGPGNLYGRSLAKTLKMVGPGLLRTSTGIPLLSRARARRLRNVICVLHLHLILPV